MLSSQTLKHSEAKYFAFWTFTRNTIRTSENGGEGGEGGGSKRTKFDSRGSKNSVFGRRSLMDDPKGFPE